MATLQEILAARKLPELMTMNDGGAVAGIGGENAEWSCWTFCPGGLRGFRPRRFRLHGNWRKRRLMRIRR